METADYVITSQPSSAVVQSMDSYKLEFKVSKPATFQWYKDDTLLPLATNSVLEITNTVPGDSGNYHAVATSDGKTLSSRIASFVCRPRVAVLVAGKEESGVARIEGPVIVRLVAAERGSKIRYTLDGSEPNEKSRFYAWPFIVTKGQRLRVSVDGVEAESVRFLMKAKAPVGKEGR